MALDRNFWTGVFVLGTGAVGLGVFMLAAMNQFQPNVTRYNVAADELAGAAEGTSVLMNGYELGIVESVEVLASPRLHFTLTIALEPGVPIPVGTVGELAPRSLAGGVILRLIPPAVDTTERLAPGATIPATAAPTFPELIAKGQTALAEIDAFAAEMREVAINGPNGKPGISATLARANTTFDDLDRLLRSLQATTDAAGPQMQRDLAHLDESLAAADQVVLDVHGLVDDQGSFPVLIEHLNASLVQMEAAAKAIQAYDPAGETEIGHVVTQLDEASMSMQRFMAAFEKKPLRTLTKGAGAVPPAEGEAGVASKPQKRENERKKGKK